MLTIEELEKLERVIPQVSEIISKCESLLKSYEEELAKVPTIDELKKALESDDIEVVKDALAGAIELLKKWAKSIGYGDYPEPECNSTEEEQKDEVVEEFKRKIEELQVLVEEKEKKIEELEKELKFVERKNILNEINNKEDWSELKETIVKLSDEEFEKMISKLAVSVNDAPTVPEKAHISSESLADKFKEFFKGR